VECIIFHIGTFTRSIMPNDVSKDTYEEINKEKTFMGIFGNRSYVQEEDVLVPFITKDEKAFMIDNETDFIITKCFSSKKADKYGKLKWILKIEYSFEGHIVTRMISFPKGSTAGDSLFSELQEFLKTEPFEGPVYMKLVPTSLGNPATIICEHGDSETPY